MPDQTKPHIRPHAGDEAAALAAQGDLAVILSLSDRSEYARQISGFIQESMSVIPVPKQGGHMAKPERMRLWEWEGIRWWFSDNSETSGVVRTIVNLVEHGELPDRLVQATTDILFAQQPSQHDVFAQYIPGATGYYYQASAGLTDSIHVYRGDALSVGVLAHEMAHNLAKKLYGSTAPSPDSEFMRAAQGEEFQSDYASAMGPHEDFAESVEMFIISPADMKRLYPKRYTIIERILSDDSFGG